MELRAIVSGNSVRVGGMLLLGSAERNTGKTELACRLITRLAREREVVGVKVTVIRENEDTCPRGGEECGVYTSLRQPFQLTEEKGFPFGKDTSRMVAAGARRVYWLRVRETHLTQGRDALLERFAPDAVTVCESNSLRLVVEPDLFFIVRSAGHKAMKPSACRVLPQADEVIASDGCSFSVAPESMTLESERWTYRRRATAVVLAGGASSRMGCNKALLPIDGRPMIERIVRKLEKSFEEILISARDQREYAFLGHHVVADRLPGQGPLMGIASALETSSHEVNLVVPCDVPDGHEEIIPGLLRAARDRDGAVPETDQGLEPHFAVYQRSTLPAIREALDRGERRIVSFFNACRIERLRLPNGVELRNLNTPAEYEQRRIWGPSSNGRKPG